MHSQNVKAEIDFFNKVAESGNHYDTISEEGYKYIFKIIKKYVRGYVLDAGCGSGAFGKRISSEFSILKIDGVDLNSTFVKMANKLNVYNLLKSGNIEDLDLYKKRQFDTIICPYLLHHLPSVKTAINNYHEWLKPGGYLIIIDPNGSNLVLRFSYLIRQLVSIFFKNNIYGSTNESHKKISEFVRGLKKFDIKTITSFQHSSITSKHSFPKSLIELLVIFQSKILIIYNLLPWVRYPGSDIIIVARKK